MNVSYMANENVLYICCKHGKDVPESALGAEPVHGVERGHDSA